MSNIEIYQKWLPLPELSGKVLIDKLVDTDEGLSVYIRFPSYSALHEKRVHLLFDSYVAYRNMDESYKTKTFDTTGGLEGSFYQVVDSSWLKWLHEESLGIYKDDDILHYSIITEADCIDILSEYPPEVNWV